MQYLGGLDLLCQFNQLVTFVARAPQCADVGTHAAAGNRRDRNVVFLQYLDNADMGQALGAPARYSQPQAHRFVRPSFRWLRSGAPLGGARGMHFGV